MAHPVIWTKIFLLILAFVLFITAIILLGISGGDSIAWYIWVLLSLALVILLIVIMLELIVPKSFCVEDKPVPATNPEGVAPPAPTHRHTQTFVEEGPPEAPHRRTYEETLVSGRASDYPAENPFREKYRESMGDPGMEMRTYPKENYDNPFREQYRGSTNEPATEMRTFSREENPFRGQYRGSGEGPLAESPQGPSMGRYSENPVVRRTPCAPGCYKSEEMSVPRRRSDLSSLGRSRSVDFDEY